MPTLLSRRLAERIEEGLRSPSADDMAALLFELHRRRPVDGAPPAALRLARELELVAGGDGAPGPADPRRPPRLTPLGAKASTPLSEYLFWRARGRRHHGSRELPVLEPERLRGRRIVEIGCGACTSLLSLQRFAEPVGVEIEALSLELAGIVARLEGLPAPRRVCAPAERLPFEDGAFDVALFFGSLQYMRIQRALAEAARVLRPGGRLVAILADRGQETRNRLRRCAAAGWSPGSLVREARAVAGMALYPAVGRLLLPRFGAVHPTRRAMERWLAGAGLEPNPDETATVGAEVCFVADKPAAAPVAVRVRVREPEPLESPLAAALTCGTSPIASLAASSAP